MSMSYLIVFTFLVSLARAEVEYTADVTTELGLVRGTVVTSVDNAKVEAFRGIRFGHAGRFEIAKPVTAWKGVYDATHLNYSCPQGFLKPPTGNEEVSPEETTFMYYSEDCLYLNIWRLAKPSSTGPRAVMVWIHGGGYMWGSSGEDYYQGQHLSTLGDVIVISFNYRLSTFGFLNVGDESIVPSNLGLQDQLLALKWIRENKLIESFGGDPNRVTLFGESAGSLAVSSQVVSPLSASQGLFQRVILQSGAFFTVDFMDTQEQAREKFRKFAVLLNCADEDVVKVVECLKSKTTEELVDSSPNQLQSIDLTSGIEAFMPVYPSPFFPKSPRELVDSLDASIEVMFGVTNDEGSIFVKGMINQTLEAGLELNADTLPEWIRKTIRAFRVPDHQGIVDYYKKFASKTSTLDELKTILGNIWGDYVLACPMVILGEAIIGKSTKSVYAYNFKHPTPLPFMENVEPWLGTCHFAEVMFMFGSPFSHPDRYSAEDVQLATEMINAWTLFAKTGKPSKMYNVEWMASGKEVDYLHIEVGNTHMKSPLLKERCLDFWKPRLLPRSGKSEL